jgi:hypothetical protein
MATKKASKKKAGGSKKAAKKGAKKGAKKAALGLPVNKLACLRRCHEQFLRCLQTTHNFPSCVTQYQRCIRACLGL